MSGRHELVCCSAGCVCLVLPLPEHSQPEHQQLRKVLQVSYLLMYGELPAAPELSRWEEAVMRHSAIPAAVEKVLRLCQSLLLLLLLLLPFS